MAPIAIFGITNDALNLAVKLLILFLVAIWLSLVFWTFADARRRVGDPLLVACATVASLVFPFLGTIVYSIVRPPEYLADVHERELEIAAAEARLAAVEGHHCPHCEFEIEKTFLRCPSCLRKLKEPCTVCNRPLDPRWKICPYCESEVGAAAPRQARGRSGTRRTAASSGSGQRPSSAAAAAGQGSALRQQRASAQQSRPPAGANPVQPPQQPTQEYPAPTPRSQRS